MFRIIYSKTKISKWGHPVQSETGITKGEYDCIEGARNEVSRRLYSLTKRPHIYDSRIIEGGYKKELFHEFSESKYEITPRVDRQLIVVNLNKNTREKTIYHYSIVKGDKNETEIRTNTNRKIRK